MVRVDALMQASQKLAQWRFPLKRVHLSTTSTSDPSREAEFITRV